MTYFPYQRIKLKTKLSVAAAMQRLSEVTEKTYSFGTGGKTFSGFIYGDKIEIQRVIYYSDGETSLGPLIYGKIEAGKEGAIISVRMNVGVMPTCLAVTLIINLFVWLKLLVIWKILTSAILLYIIVMAFYNFERNKMEDSLFIVLGAIVIADTAINDLREK